MKISPDIKTFMQTFTEPAGDMSDAIFYRDVYYHKTWTSPVVHLGINTSNKTIASDLLQHNTQQVTKISGITNASNATQYQPFVKAIMLTQWESGLMERALRYLDDSGGKIVIVDTFPRALKAAKGLNLGDIEVSSSKTFSTHAAILYKNTQGNILVIDPNNPKFSGHLQKYAGNIKVSDNPSDLHKVYSSPSGSKKGPKGDEYRDCIDIAVKLAALLSLDSNHYTSHDEVMRSKAVSLVSNNATITSLPIDTPLRIKQVSSFKKIQDVNKALLEQNGLVAWRR